MRLHRTDNRRLIAQFAITTISRPESAGLCSSGHRIAGTLILGSRPIVPWDKRGGGSTFWPLMMFTVAPTAFVPEWMASRGRPYRRLRAVGSMPVGSP
jgi:hypothetical protein